MLRLRSMTGGYSLKLLRFVVVSLFWTQRGQKLYKGSIMEDKQERTMYRGNPNNKQEAYQ